MRNRTGDPRWRSLQLVGAALYVIFLLTAPFEHHDLACELKTPRHCTSCVSSQPGSDPHAASTLNSGALADAGWAVSMPVVARGVLLVVRTTGRSPPRLL